MALDDVDCSATKALITLVKNGKLAGRDRPLRGLETDR